MGRSAPTAKRGSVKGPGGVPMAASNSGLPNTIKKIKVVNSGAAKTVEPGKKDTAGGEVESSPAKLQAEKKKAEIIDYVHKR